MPFFADLQDGCGDVLEPVLCLIGCFFLIALGVWSAMAVARKHRGGQALPALVFGITLVAAAFPGVVISGAWISCSVSNDAPQSASFAPALRNASLAPRAPGPCCTIAGRQ